MGSDAPGRASLCFHVRRGLAERVTSCSFLHETREHRLTDHAAVSLALNVDRVAWLRTGSLVEEEAATLF